MKTIYLIVGKKVVQVNARICGKIAEVMTEVGIREFGKWYDTLEQANESVTRKLTRS